MTPEQRIRSAMYSTGQTLNQIARSRGVTRQAVASSLKACGVSIRSRGDPLTTAIRRRARTMAESSPYNKVALDLGISIGSVFNAVHFEGDI